MQRIALAIARELGLERKKLEALRHGALFHDIGKLGVPDAILTKPAKLSAVEEIRAGRGSQFAPLVVDAFFEALAKAPEELAASDAQALAS